MGIFVNMRFVLRTFSITIFISLLLQNFATAQDNDLGLWNLVGVTYPVSEKSEASFAQSLRLNDNLTNAQNLLSQLDWTYKFNENTDITFAYRWSFRSTLDRLKRGESRFQVSLEHKKPFARNWEFKHRLRLQSRYRHYASDENYGTYTNQARYLIGFLYAKYSVKPYTSTEFFTSLNGDTFGNALRWRLRFGFEVDINEKLCLEPYFNFQRNFKSGAYLDELALGWELSYTIQ